jgi:hypothetical protein
MKLANSTWNSIPKKLGCCLNSPIHYSFTCIVHIPLHYFQKSLKVWNKFYPSFCLTIGESMKSALRKMGELPSFMDSNHRVASLTKSNSCELIDWTIHSWIHFALIRTIMHVYMHLNPEKPRSSNPDFSMTAASELTAPTRGKRTEKRHSQNPCRLRLIPWWLQHF